jgi:hypothetical protein
MGKIKFIFAFFLVNGYLFAQTNISNYNSDLKKREINFHSVEKSKIVLNENDLKNYKYQIIDTINNPFAFIIKEQEKGEGTISIAIKNNNEFNLYQLIAKKLNTESTIIEKDTTTNLVKKVNKTDAKKIEFNPRNINGDYLNIIETKNVNFDDLENKGLLIKFTYNIWQCSTCSTQHFIYNYSGILIFDFKKLQVAVISTQEDLKIDFKKNHCKIKRKKYNYKLID